jgi:glutaminyl-tRNA synthetase
MRDPIIYRVLKTKHHKRPTNDTGREWNVFPMYDYAHCISDSLESIDYSLCTLEFEVHRPLYEWILNTINSTGVDLKVPRQIEFARLNLDYTVMSKRKLNKLVSESLVESWDDPRLPTIAGLRRAGYTPESIFNFMDKVGIAKRDNVIDIKLLEHSVRDDLNKKANRIFAVLDPLKLTITNYPEDKVDQIEVSNNPEDESCGTRYVPFSKHLWIESEDFREEANSKYKRLVPGRFIRLLAGYIVECTGCRKDESGNVVEVFAEYVPESRSGNDTSGIKPKGAIHYVSDIEHIDIEVREYDRLFKSEVPIDNSDLNENSLNVYKNCKIEDYVRKLKVGETVQFQRLGYFSLDKDSDESLIFNKTIGLRSNW